MQSDTSAKRPSTCASPDATSGRQGLSLWVPGGLLGLLLLQLWGIGCTTDPVKCSASEACYHAGLCSTDDAGRCVALTEADCEKAFLCTNNKYCYPYKGECSRLYEGYCESAQNTSCKEEGKCKISDSRDACIARTSEDCKASTNCQDADKERCFANNGACMKADEISCGRSYSCQQHGLCGFDEKNKACIATTALDCARSRDCKEKGRCLLQEGACVIGEAPEVTSESITDTTAQEPSAPGDQVSTEPVQEGSPETTDAGETSSEEPTADSDPTEADEDTDEVAGAGGEEVADGGADSGPEEQSQEGTDSDEGTADADAGGPEEPSTEVMDAGSPEEPSTEESTEADQMPACTNVGTSRCQGNTVVECRSDGTLQFTNCASDERCESGRCVLKCSPAGKQECKDTQTLRTCQADGSWQEQSCSGGQECRNGACQTPPACQSGQTRSCYTGTQGTAGKGLCKAGTQGCEPNGTWSTTCNGEVTPATEACDGKDNDCDGTVDNNLTRPLCTKQQGACQGARKLCGGTNGWIDCNDAAYRAQNADYQPTETKCDGKDNDCNGSIDEPFPNKGMACTMGKGECERNGNAACKADGSGLECSATAGTPATEVCDGKDNDCDGTVDNKLTRPLCTKQQGACQGARKLCGGTNGWIDCNDAAYRAQNADYQPTETRCDGKDNDCNGSIDEPFPNKGMACTAGQGACQRPGTAICKADGSGLRCSATPGNPTAEICDGKDNDCDGSIDENDGTPLCTGGLRCRMGQCQP